MSIAKLLQRHQASLEEARKALERPRAGKKDLQLGETLKKRRIAEVSARVARLEAERQATVERIDRAIAAEKDALAVLERAISIPQRPSEGIAREKPKEPERKPPPGRTTPAEPTTNQRPAGKPTEGRSAAAQPTPTTTRRRPKT
jgi:hypothetical protein